MQRTETQMTTQDLRLPPIRYLVSAALCFLGTIVFISSNSPAEANVISNRLSRHGDSSPAGWLHDRIGPATTRTTLASSAGSTNTSTRPAAAFVILARENDLIPILESIRQMEGMLIWPGSKNRSSNRAYLRLSERSIQPQASLRLRVSEPRTIHKRLQGGSVETYQWTSAVRPHLRNRVVSSARFH